MIKYNNQIFVEKSWKSENDRTNQFDHFTKIIILFEKMNLIVKVIV